MSKYVHQRNPLSKLKAACIYLILLISGISKTNAQHSNIPLKIANLQSGFVNIPDTIQTTVYWYWVSDNISKQGVINDLEAMKRVGINRAFIGNVRCDDVPYGKVKLFTPKWWDIMHTALKTATRLNIEIGIFNSPGWSQSGGPWIKPSQSMRYLTSSELLVQGPLKVSKKISSPQLDFQDVKTIAYPAPNAFNSYVRGLKLTSQPEMANLERLTDSIKNTYLPLPTDSPFKLYLESVQPFTLRSVTIETAKLKTYLEGIIQVKIGSTYKTIQNFSVDRTNDELIVGFLPYGPATIAIPATTGKEFRICFEKVQKGSGISEIKLSSAPVLESYIEKTLSKMWPTPFPYWQAYQWLPQPIIEDKSLVINPDKVIDISKFVSENGILTWNVPPGKWAIERMGMTPTKVTNSPATPEGTGLEADKMSKKHIHSHFDAFLGEIMKRISPEDRKTWKVTVEDSYETGGQNWTDDLIEKFQTSYGYSPLPYLPVMQGKVVGSADQSDRFLWDLRRFVADNLANEYVAGLREASHKHGLTTWLESYGHWGFPGEFLQYGGQSDEVAGEFWTVGDLGNIENRAASSCAHIYGKNKVSSESFTSGSPAFSGYPALFKQRADRFFTEGINNTLLHVYIQQPSEDKVPGLNAWFGTEFNRHNTWFNEMGDFMKYIKRCNFMLQQGRYVAEVAYFISEDAPKMTGVRDPELPQGYSFDYVNAEVIKTRMTVKDGRLVLPDGMNYRILVLPKLETMRPQLLLKIKELVNQGAVVLGPRPSRSPSLQNFGSADMEVQKLSKELWGDINGSSIKTHRYGNGMVIDGMNLEEAMNLLKVGPDFKTPAADSLLFVHRELNDVDMYFVSNQKNQGVKFSADFRMADKTPQLWNPVTGQMHQLVDYEETDSTVKVPLELAPYESAFIVFKAHSGSKVNDLKNSTRSYGVKINYPEVIRSIKITGDWLVEFDSKMRGPAKPVVLKELQDWSTNKEDSIKYYSGTAVYHQSFKRPKTTKNERVLLSLGSVKAMASVKINGVEVGGVWTPPYRIDITDMIKSGKNDMKIKVVNTWVNRLIGDSKLPEKERKTAATYNKYTPQSPLTPSGLMGPVQLQIVTNLFENKK